jgi:putative SOS response-associated peptidase YedK
MRRCIVPMDVFYERDKRKKLHAFAMTDGTPFGVAGIRESWRNQNGAWERTFCIITVPANELVRVAHDRMAAIIPIAQRPVGSPNNFCGGRRLLFFVVLFDLTQADSNANQE